MAGSMNEVNLIGHLGADPEIKKLNDGRPVANLRLATSESWKDKNTGEKRERTEWHRITIFNEGLCGVVEKYTRKGSKIFVRGQLQTRKWQDQSGQDRYSTEVVLQGFGGQIILLDGKRDGDSGGDYDRGRSDSGSARSAGRTGGGSLSDDMDEEIPF